MTGKTDIELDKALVDSRALLRSERFSAAGARAKNVNTKSNLRAIIARALTERSARASRARTSA